MPKPIPRSVTRTPQPLEIVDPRWILKALGFTIAFALGCAYITVCILFFYQQWQLVLHPSHDVSRSPADVGLAFSEVRFANDATGQPQLDGWWIPSSLSDQPSGNTALILHSGAGSMSDALPAARILHDARLNVLLFDYRGFGHSGGKHPTEKFMEADSDAALRYLLDTRQIPASSIILYGTGAGGSLAVRLSTGNSQIAALILDSPEGDFQPRVRRDPRATIVPVRLLFHEDFPLVKPLSTLATPKLLLADTSGTAPPDFTQAADPKTTVEFAKRSDAEELRALTRFLDTYMPRQPAVLAPSQ